MNFDIDNVQEAFTIKLIAVAEGYRLDHLMLQGFAKEWPNIVDRIADTLTLALKAYVYGGDSDQITLSFPDGPLERFKARHRWARRLLGQVRMFRREMTVTSFYPDMESRFHPAGIGQSLTLHVDGDVDKHTAVNIIRRTESELANFRYKCYKNGLSREDQDKFLDDLGVRIL